MIGNPEIEFSADGVIVVDVWYWADSMSLTQVRGNIIDSDTMPGLWIEGTLDGRRTYFPWTSVQRMIPVEGQK